MLIVYQLMLTTCVCVFTGQAMTDQRLSVLEINCYIRGYHVYKDTWSATIGETLLVKKEIENTNYPNAVAIFNENTVVGHVPRNLAPKFFHFLSRDTCKAFVEVTGSRVNRGAGFGLEIPCKYRLYGPPAYIRKMDELVSLRQITSS